MSTRSPRPLILCFIGWNLLFLAFLCFLYVATVQKGVGMELVVPLGMILGGLIFGLGTKSVTTDVHLSRTELHDALLWFILCFGAILTLHVGVVASLSHAPFKVQLGIMDLKMYGIFMGIAETIAFQGAFLGWWATMTRYYGPYFAVPLSAGAWTLFHLMVYGTHPLALFMVLMVGVLIGFVAWHKRYLWIVMGAHALVNFVAIGGYHILATLVPALLISAFIIMWILRRRR